MSASVPILTVTIPTYNRPVELMDTIAQLSRQPGIERCKILILDNCSPVPVAGLLDAPPGFPNLRIEVVRHVANIGGNANILRCMELARTEWVWILGDDDELAPDAISHILAVCEQGGDGLDFILFSQFQGQTGGLRTRSTEEFLDHVDAWARLGFISTGVYRTARTQALLNIGCNYAYSLFPFVAIVINGLDQHGWTAELNSQVLVHPTHKAANTWPLMASVNGYLVAETTENPAVAGKLLQLASGWCLGPIGLTHEYARRSLNQEPGLPRYSYLHKLHLIGSVSWSLKIQATACRLISHLPAAITVRLIDGLRRASGKEVVRKRGGDTALEQL
jgi:hypothetical protein